MTASIQNLLISAVCAELKTKARKTIKTMTVPKTGKKATSELAFLAVFLRFSICFPSPYKRFGICHNTHLSKTTLQSVISVKILFF